MPKVENKKDLKNQINKDSNKNSTNICKKSVKELINNKSVNKSSNSKQNIKEEVEIDNKIKIILSPHLENKIIKSKSISSPDLNENTDHDFINSNSKSDSIDRITFNPYKTNNDDPKVDKIEKNNFLNLIVKMKDKKIKSNSNTPKGNQTDRDID